MLHHLILHQLILLGIKSLQTQHHEAFSPKSAIKGNQYPWLISLWHSTPFYLRTFQKMPHLLPYKILQVCHLQCKGLLRMLCHILVQILTCRMFLQCPRIPLTVLQGREPRQIFIIHKGRCKVKDNPHLL